MNPSDCFTNRTSHRNYIKSHSNDCQILYMLVVPMVASVILLHY